MNDYYKYFPNSKKDESWGLNVLHAGCNSINKNERYPSVKHPAHHNFSWNSGRIIHEFALVYITRGKGVFESESAKGNISEGSIFLIHPNEKHRYKPDEHIGWDEHWVGFSGSFIENIILKDFLNKKEPIYNIGYNETIINLFDDIINISKEEKAGYQAVISGIIMHLLGLIYANKIQGILGEQNLIEVTVSKARVIFRSKIYEEVDPQNIADELSVSYSWFRKVFKKHTGLAPGQYFIQLKIQKAKELLADPKLTIKEVAYELKFKSTFYFSQLFKQKTGVTPSEYRNTILRKYEF